MVDFVIHKCNTKEHEKLLDLDSGGICPKSFSLTLLPEAQQREMQHCAPIALGVALSSEGSPTSWHEQ